MDSMTHGFELLLTLCLVGAAGWVLLTAVVSMCGWDEPDEREDDDD